MLSKSLILDSILFLNLFNKSNTLSSLVLLLAIILRFLFFKFLILFSNVSIYLFFSFNSLSSSFALLF